MTGAPSTPGGSSSGSGIAVSANLVAVAVGTETSGSILSPGTANGVVGIKPTLGLVSRDGILPITADQDTAGPLARTVTDAAILLGVIAGFDPNDAATAACLVPGNCHKRLHEVPEEARAPRRADRRARACRTGMVSPPRSSRSCSTRSRRSAREGAFVADPYEIPNQAAISAFGICVSFPAPSNCSTVLMYGQKHDLNNYLASRPTRRSIR